MRIIATTIITFCLLTVCQAQTIYISTNLKGYYRIVVDHTNDKTIMMTPDSYAQVNCGKLLEVWYSDSSHVTQYEFENFPFKDNDTIRLRFTFYHSIDTSFYSSGCLDGTNQVNKQTITEFNHGSTEITLLPDSMVILTAKSRIVLKKTVDVWHARNRGHGKKEGKDWGYVEITPTRHVVYRKQD